MEDNNKIYGTCQQIVDQVILPTYLSPISGFTISMPDWEPTIPTLWSSIQGGETDMRGATKNIDRHRIEFATENPQYLHPDNSMDFLSDNSGETYNLCHCEWIFSRRDWARSPHQVVWSNFEIADMDFWRSEAYMKYFEFLEEKGGFYYEVRPCIYPLLFAGLTIAAVSVGEMHLSTA